MYFSYHIVRSRFFKFGISFSKTITELDSQSKTSKIGGIKLSHIITKIIIRFNSFTDRKFYQNLQSQFVDRYFTNELTYKNNSSKKLISVVFIMLVSPSKINLPMNLQTDKAHQKKLALFHQYFPREVFHITDQIPYAILLVFLFVCR